MMRVPDAGPQRGYILIYAVTVLLFLVGTVTGAAYGLRMDAQETARQQELMRAEFRLRGALQYMQAQFVLASPAPTTGSPTPTRPTVETPGRGWRLEPGTWHVVIDGEDVSVTISDPGGIADANLFDEGMWTRYFAAAAGVTPEVARRWAATVMSRSETTGRISGRKGFADIDELLALDSLPVSVRYGSNIMGERTGPEEFQPGLAEVLLAGAGDRSLDPSRAALPLVAALTGADAERLSAYTGARQQRRLTVEDAQRILGNRTGTVMQDSRPDAILRVVLSTSAGNHRTGMLAFVRRQENNVRLLSARLHPAPPQGPEQTLQ